MWENTVLQHKSLSARPFGESCCLSLSELGENKRNLKWLQFHFGTAKSLSVLSVQSTSESTVLKTNNWMTVVRTRGCKARQAASREQSHKTQTGTWAASCPASVNYLRYTRFSCNPVSKLLNAKKKKKKEETWWKISHLKRLLSNIIG